MSADCFVPAVTTLLFFAQNTAFRSHLPKKAITHCHLVLMAQTARNLKLLLLHFSSLALSWEPGHFFYWQRELHSRAENLHIFFSQEKTDLTVGATTIQRLQLYFNFFCSDSAYMFSCCFTVSQQACPGAELLLQQPPPFSVLPGKDLKSESWDTAAGWERILPTEHLWQF